MEQAREAAAQSDRLENQTTFPPPADGELSEAQVRRFLAVHERTRNALGPRWTELQAQADRIEEQAKRDARQLSFSEMVTMVRSLGSIMVEARRAHVDALNAEQFSTSEYTWVRLRAYEAAGLEVMEGIDWSQIQDAMKDGARNVDVSERYPSQARRPGPKPRAGEALPGGAEGVAAADGAGLLRIEE